MSKELLGSDARILDLVSRREARPGLWVLSFPGEFMPDGHPVEWQHRGQLNHADLVTFCNVVRGEYNARETGNQAPPVEPPPARSDGSEQPDRPARESGGGSVPAPPPVPDVEATLADVIETQVSRLRDQVADVESRIAELGDQRLELLERLAAAERAQEAYHAPTDTHAKKPKARRSKRTKKPATRKGSKDNGASGQAGDTAQDS